MEITCPRCESVFAADPEALLAHDCQAQCSVCDHTFKVEDGPCAERSAAKGGVGRKIMVRFLQFLALLLVLALVAQGIWWGRGYIATVPILHRWLVEGAERLGTPMPWPEQASHIQILDSQVQAMPDGQARITGTLRNAADFVQAFPELRVTLSNTIGTRIKSVSFEPGQYLPADVHTAEGFRPGSKVAFTLSGAQLTSAPSYQIEVVAAP